MLKDAVDKIKGEYVEEEVDENLDNRSLIDVDTHIDDNYIKYLSQFDKHIAYNKNEKRP